MTKFNYLEETKKNATKGFSELAVKAASVLVCLYLWMCMLITRCITVLRTPRLESQSDKDYARSKYAARVQNSKNATSRKHDSLHVPKTKGNKKKITLETTEKFLNRKLSILFLISISVHSTFHMSQEKNLL